MPKHIFVTGGVVSSLGKGLTSGAVGTLLESRGLRIAVQKMDPYINVDPGTMSPFQHGEVYVTDDGAETDLDLGHYERFTNAKITRESNYTTGRIYLNVIQKERRGEYLGKTVQVVPHITNEIKDAIRRASLQEVDVAITEIGGTVGDIESLPFLEAIRQMGWELGRENVCFVHLTLIPYLRASGEMKTKPTQHSVGKLREIGIQPDMLLCRTEQHIGEDERSKIALFCNIAPSHVIEEKDVDTSIYEVPIVLAQQGLDELIVQHLHMQAGKRDISVWERIVGILKDPQRTVEIAVVGKYLEVTDSYKSMWESLTHGGIANGAKLKLRKVNAQDVEKQGAEKLLSGVHGLLVPGGFGERGVEGKIAAVKFAREKKIPYFGLCLGMQCATIEYARSQCGIKDANSAEFAPDGPDSVICLMDSQKQVVDKGGTMRLGAFPCHLQKGSRAQQAYGADVVHERHRHRYEFNNAYRAVLEKAGFRISGTSPDGKLVEIIELEDHPWFLATQFHPEFKSKPTAAHPLFRAFVKAALDHAERT
ncbi:MAG: CTP synthase [Planctomycetes bacterium]|nr:CTP synthase [Planctomycetota bacterium]